MKLTIQNLDKYNSYADVWFPANGNVKRIEVASELSDKYIFNFEIYDIRFEVHLLRHADFMPGWPIEVWGYDENMNKWKRLSETNTKQSKIKSKAEWCKYVKDLVELMWDRYKSVLQKN